MLRRSFIVALAACTLGLAPCRGQDTWQEQADRLAALLNWQPGSVVAEIGAGNGRLTLAAAQRVGPSGKVYTTELHAKDLAHLEELAAKEKNLIALKAAEHRHQPSARVLRQHLHAARISPPHETG